MLKIKLISCYLGDPIFLYVEKTDESGTMPNDKERIIVINKTHLKCTSISALAYKKLYIYIAV